MSSRLVRPVGFCFSIVLLSSCGDGRLDTVPVRGTVSCGGQPLTSGSISFTPVVEGKDAATAARSASGVVGPDGTFVLTTYEANDGALVGKHIVTYMPPPPPGEGIELGDDAAPATPALPPAPVKRGQKVPCQFGGKTEIEVVEGENDLKVELSPLSAGGQDDDDSGAD